MRGRCDHPERWRDISTNVGPDGRSWYDENGRKTIPARARFEQELLAFAATMPRVTQHSVRTLLAVL